MTQEEKQLLIKDLSARLPYGVEMWFPNVIAPIVLDEFVLSVARRRDEEFKPYLRLMSSMTKEEAIEMFYTVFHHVSVLDVDIESDRFIFKMVDGDGQFAGHTIWFFGKIYSLEQSDWLLSHHFDYRGLIEKGLALEAPEGMYKTE